MQIITKIRKSGSPQIHKTAHKFDMLNVVIERLMVLYDNFDTSIPQFFNVFLEQIKHAQKKV